MLPALLGLADWQVDALVAAAWFVILATNAAQYHAGTIPPARAFGWTAVACFWLGFTGLEFAGRATGTLATSLLALSSLLGLAGFGLAAQWWRHRGRPPA